MAKATLVPSTLSVNALRELLDYDPETGVFTWRVSRGGIAAGTNAGVIATVGYRYISISEQKYLAHRLAWFYVHGEWPPADIDHENGNRCDNRIANLRCATRSENNANMPLRKDNTTGFKGVYHHSQNNNWVAEIWRGKKKTHLGCFATPEAAHEAYRIAAERIYGRFANP